MSDYLRILNMVKQDSTKKFLFIRCEAYGMGHIILEKAPEEKEEDFALRVLDTYNHFPEGDEEIARELHLDFWSIDNSTRVL